MQNHRAESAVRITLRHDARPCPTIASVVNSGTHICNHIQLSFHETARFRRNQEEEEEEDEEEEEGEEEE